MKQIFLCKRTTANMLINKRFYKYCSPSPMLFVSSKVIGGKDCTKNLVQRFVLFIFVAL